MARVVIVHQDPQRAADLARVIGRAGHRAAVAESGREAIGAMVRSGAGVVLISRMLRDMDGFSLLRRLKEHPATTEAQVLMLLADDDTCGVAEACALGAAGHIPGSAPASEVLSRTERALGAQGATRSHQLRLWDGGPTGWHGAPAARAA